jgi:hypothetical protein
VHNDKICRVLDFRSVVGSDMGVSYMQSRDG